MIRVYNLILLSGVSLLLCVVAAAAPPPIGTAVKILSPRFFPGWQSQNVTYPFVVNDTVVTFALSFDNDRAAAPTADIVKVSAAAR